MGYFWSPSDVCNEALDALGQPGKIIGDLTDGTPVAETARRNYGRVLRSLLRAAHWGFARKEAELELLGDATGQSDPPVVTYVEKPWQFAYAWPIDGVAGRWMPMRGPLGSEGTTCDSSGVPLTTAGGETWRAVQMPARFLVSSSDQYPVVNGEAGWNQLPDFQRTEGVGLVSRKVILTDHRHAHFVYTRLVTSIEEWDDGFHQAMKASMAVVLAPVAIDDVKLRQATIAQLLPLARNAINDARTQSANESGFPQSTDHQPDWLTARNGGFWGASFGGNLGTYGLYLPWDQYSLGGSVM